MTYYKEKALVICPAATWPGIIARERRQVHPADFWALEDPEAPLSIADVRQLLYFASFTPVGEAKLVILSGADTFRPETANALLKLIEEPPAYLRIMVLAQTANLLPTLLSRLPRLADLGQSATIESKVGNLGLWQKRLQSLDLRAEPQRQTAKNLLYLYPLAHAGIKTENILEVL